MRTYFHTCLFSLLIHIMFVLIEGRVFQTAPHPLQLHLVEDELAKGVDHSLVVGQI